MEGSKTGSVHNLLMVIVDSIAGMRERCLDSYMECSKAYMELL